MAPQTYQDSSKPLVVKKFSRVSCKRKELEKMEGLARDEKRKGERTLTIKRTSYIRTGASAGKWDKHSFRIMVGDWTASFSASYRSCPGGRPNAIKPQHFWPSWSARKEESRVSARERDRKNSRYLREKNQPLNSFSLLSSLSFSLSHTHLPRNCNASWKWSRDMPAVSSMSLPRKPPRGKRVSNRGRDETTMLEWSRNRLAIFQRPQY